jgi:hypothetical protein
MLSWLPVILISMALASLVGAALILLELYTTRLERSPNGGDSLFRYNPASVFNDRDSTGIAAKWDSGFVSMYTIERFFAIASVFKVILCWPSAYAVGEQPSSVAAGAMFLVSNVSPPAKDVIASASTTTCVLKQLKHATATTSNVLTA